MPAGHLFLIFEISDLFASASLILQFIEDRLFFLKVTVNVK
jgi:hypothetical protein